MRRLTFFLALAASLAIARADTVDFEDLPLNNIANFGSCDGGGTPIGNYYAGVGVASIGPDAVGLDSSCGITGYPPNSGNINVLGADDFTTISFRSLESSVSVYYVAYDPIVLTAYDSSNNIIGSNTGLANTDGFTGSDSLLSVTAPDISYVTLGNIGLAFEYTFDDLSFTPIPEPLSLPFSATVFVLFILIRVIYRYREQP